MRVVARVSEGEFMPATLSMTDFPLSLRPLC